MKRNDYKTLFKELASLSTLTDLSLAYTDEEEYNPVSVIFTCVNQRIPVLPGVVFNTSKEFDEENGYYKDVRDYDELNINNLKDVHTFVCNTCDNELLVTNEYVQEACYDHILAHPEDSEDFIIEFCTCCGKAHIFESLVPHNPTNIALPHIHVHKTPNKNKI